MSNCTEINVDDAIKNVENKILTISWCTSGLGYNDVRKSLENDSNVNTFLKWKNISIKDYFFSASDFEKESRRFDVIKSDVLISVNEFGEDFELEDRFENLCNSNIKVIIAEVYSPTFLEMAKNSELILITVKFYSINSLTTSLIGKMFIHTENKEIESENEINDDFKIKIFFKKQDISFSKMTIKKTSVSGLSFQSYIYSGETYTFMRSHLDD
jgi:hypothetical protein